MEYKVFCIAKNKPVFFNPLDLSHVVQKCKTPNKTHTHTYKKLKITLNKQIRTATIECAVSGHILVIRQEDFKQMMINSSLTFAKRSHFNSFYDAAPFRRSESGISNKRSSSHNSQQNRDLSYSSVMITPTNHNSKTNSSHKSEESTINENDINFRDYLFVLLDNNPILHGLNNNQKEMVIEKMHELCFDQGTYIVQQGEQYGKLFVIAQGVCEVYRDNDMERTLNVGDTYGENALLLDTPSQYSLKVKQDVKCWILTREKWHKINKRIRESPLDDRIKLLRNNKIFATLYNSEIEMLSRSMTEVKRLFSNI